MRPAWTIPLIPLLLLGAAAQPDGAVLVATRRVEPTPYDLTLPEKVGLLEAGEHRALAFEVSGRLVSLADEGTSFATGEVLAELDTGLERAQLRQAELRLREARSDLKRARGLRVSKVTSEKALESAKTSVELRLAEHDAARERLQRRILLAPFDGVVAETLVEPDEVVSPGTPLVLFMDLSHVRLVLGVPGYQVGRIREDARVFVTLPGLPEERFDGVVERVAAAAPRGRHLFEVEVRIANPERRLRPGMSARARIVTGSLASALVVPLDAAVERNGESVIFFVEAGRARAVSVAGAALSGHELVLEPAPAYRELVVRGQRDLRDGMLVRVDRAVLADAP